MPEREEPLGAALGGFEKGYGLVDAIQQRKRRLQREQQEDFVLLYQLANQIGREKASKIIGQLGLRVSPEELGALPEVGEEARKTARETISPALAEQFNIPSVPGGITREQASGISLLERGQASLQRNRIIGQHYLDQDLKSLDADVKDAQSEMGRALQSMATLGVDDETKKLALTQYQQAKQAHDLAVIYKTSLQQRKGIRPAGLPGVTTGQPVNPLGL